jgi:hypothetical protein
MKKKKMAHPSSSGRRLVLPVLFLICLASSGCSFLISDDYGIRVVSKTITLQWDPPAGVFPYGPLAVSLYYVYFRPHGTLVWKFVCSVPPTENPSIQLKQSNFGNGSYDFGVSSHTFSGVESTLHSSTDATARPFGGWYIIWNYSD